MLKVWNNISKVKLEGLKCLHNSNVKIINNSLIFEDERIVVNKKGDKNKPDEWNKHDSNWT